MSHKGKRLSPFFIGATTPKDRAGIRQLERRNAKRSRKQRASALKNPQLARTT